MGECVKNDLLRAGLALAASLAMSAGAVQAAPWLRAQGYLGEPEERLYTILNLTEDMTAYTACPLDEDALRRQVERDLAAAGARGVYSPIAGGPDVLTIEAVARWQDDSAGCRWDLSPTL